MILRARKFYWKWQWAFVRRFACYVCTRVRSLAISMTHVLWYYCVSVSWATSADERTSRRRNFNFIYSIFIAGISLTHSSNHIAIQRPFVLAPNTNERQKRTERKSLITHSEAHAFDICDLNRLFWCCCCRRIYFFVHCSRFKDLASCAYVLPFHTEREKRIVQILKSTSTTITAAGVCAFDGVLFFYDFTQREWSLSFIFVGCVLSTI